MAENSVFATVCAVLEEESSLTRIQARGTIRLALRDGGLDPETVTVGQMLMVVERILPRELKRRALSDSICKSLASRLRLLGTEDHLRHESPEAIFARLGAN